MRQKERNKTRFYDRDQQVVNMEEEEREIPSTETTSPTWSVGSAFQVGEVVSVEGGFNSFQTQ